MSDFYELFTLGYFSQQMSEGAIICEVFERTVWCM